MAVNFNVLFATWPGLCRFYDMCDKESNEYDYGQSVEDVDLIMIPLTLMENG
jgi:hypothetical protein